MGTANLTEQTRPKGVQWLLITEKGGDGGECCCALVAPNAHWPKRATCCTVFQMPLLAGAIHHFQV